MAEENQATNKIESSDKTVANRTSKDNKEIKQAQGQEQGDKQNQNETQNKAEKDSSQTTQKQETALTKDNSSTEEILKRSTKKVGKKKITNGVIMRIISPFQIGKNSWCLVLF